MNKFTSDLVAIYNQSTLSKCTHKSLINCALQVNSLGLSMDKVLGQAYLIPFDDKQSGTTVCTVQIGVGGYKALAHRSGQIAKIFAEPIKEGEIVKISRIKRVFEFDELDIEERANAPTIGYYACIQKRDGSMEEDFITIEEFKSHSRKYSHTFANYELNINSTEKGKVYAAKRSIWHNHFDAMGCKTVLKRLIRGCGLFSTMLDPQLISAIKIDGGVFRGDIGSSAIEYLDNPLSNPIDEQPKEVIDAEVKEIRGIL